MPEVSIVVLPLTVLLLPDKNTPEKFTKPTSLPVTALFDARMVPLLPTPIPKDEFSEATEFDTMSRAVPVPLVQKPPELCVA